MLWNPHQHLEDRIVTILGKHPRLTATELQKKMQKTHRYSIQGLYKELKKLEVNGVVVKQGLDYGLRMPWVLEAVDFFKTLEKSYLTAPGRIVDLPHKGKKHIRHFNNLLQLNNYWAQVMLFLAQQTKTNIFFTYMPHSWFHLIYTEQEQQYIDAVKRAHVRLFIINSGTRYLDRWAEQFWQGSHIEYSFNARPFKQEPRSVYLNCIGEYVVTVTLGRPITNDIEQLYASTPTAESVNYSEIFRVLNAEAKSTLWLERNEKKAHRITSVFRRHFGVIRS